MSDSQMVHAGPGVTENKTLYDGLFRNKNYSLSTIKFKGDSLKSVFQKQGQQLTGKEKQEKENLQTRRGRKEKKM